MYFWGDGNFRNRDEKHYDVCCIRILFVCCDVFIKAEGRIDKLIQLRLLSYIRIRKLIVESNLLGLLNPIGNSKSIDPFRAFLSSSIERPRLNSNWSSH